MKAVDYLIKTLIKYGVTDVFGIPGRVVLDFIYSVEKTEGISAHLCYHEQGAAFAALGYAQVNGTLGVAYSTRGPGFTNLITGIADAYQGSLPVLFITAHSQKEVPANMRMEVSQELNSVPIVESITKYAVRIDKTEDFASAVQYACKIATSGRMGPVFIDVAAHIWNEEICEKVIPADNAEVDKPNFEFIKEIGNTLNQSKRPVILMGAGVRASNTANAVRNFSEKHRIPMLSSRCAQDICADSNLFFGYICSRPARYSNFILSKADLILSLGNRMSVPIDSKSYRPFFEKTKTIRIDIDENEFKREIPNSHVYKSDLKQFMDNISDANVKIFDNGWVEVCEKIKKELYNYDVEYPVTKIAEIMEGITSDSTFICDVGNHEFWVSRAYAYSGVINRFLYPLAFSALGNSVPKSIGVYYRTKRPVVCFVGDQALQMNIQELEMIGKNKLPILIVLLNNHSSGMIKSHEMEKYDSHFIHVTDSSGYGTPDYGIICQAYGIEYGNWKSQTPINRPMMIELDISDELYLTPYLPIGNEIQNLIPEIDVDLYNYINNI